MTSSRLLAFFLLVQAISDGRAATPPPLGAVKPVRHETALVSQGQPPVLLAAASRPARAAAETLCAALTKRLGVTPVVISRFADAKPGKQTAIALGNLLDNELITRLYWNRYTFEDAEFPGAEGYTIHTAFDPDPWGGGQDVIVLGASQAEQLPRAVERFLGLLRGEGSSTILPYTLVIEPAKKLTPATRNNLLKTAVDPSFAGFRVHAEKYLQTGEETYAQLAIAALDIMVETYHKNPQRRNPWPEETTAGDIFATWDAFEECPLISPEKRRDYLNAFLAWSRDLTHCSYEYRAIDEKFTVTWNHTTFALLGLYFAGRYFDRHFDLPEAKEWLRKARLGFAAQARSWKPQEDADSYLVLTMGHTIAFSLADWDLRFFENGLLQRYADYVVGCGDTRLLPAGFGDSGYGVAPAMATAALPIAYWWTRDGGYRWLLEHSLPGGWENPFWSDGVEPKAPERFVGLNVFPMDRQIYDDTQLRPTYGEAFERADVPFEQAWDKISFRENWEPDGQYLLLDGLGRGKHLHFDTNGITTFVQDGERWLIDHDYLVRNTTEHSMLSVLRDGRCAALVPSLAGLASSGDLAGMSATSTYAKGYNGVDWTRRVLWNKGAWFLVQDTVTARQNGSFDLDLTWKTIDRGDQQLTPEGRFIARRPTVSLTGMEVADDSLASNGKAVVLTSPLARLRFPVDLPPGEFAVNLFAQGVDTGSDSLFLSVDGATPQMLGLPLGSYPPPGKSRAIPLKLSAAGSHLFEIKLRENPPVKIDRIEVRRGDALVRVVEAEEVSSIQPEAAGKPVPNALHIDPATPVRAWVTNHVRQGISVPISILHQRQSVNLRAGESTTFCSLVSATGRKHASEFAVKALRPGVVDINDSIAGFGPDRSGSWRCDADAWLIQGQTVNLVGVRSLELGESGLVFAPAANASLDSVSGKMLVRAEPPVVVTTRGKATVNGQSRIELSPGLHTVTVSGFDAGRSEIRKNFGETTKSLRSAPESLANFSTKPAAKPLWSADLSKGSPVFRITPADIDGDGQLELLVACGKAGHAVGSDGKLRWSYPTEGIVRDVSLARFAKGGPATVLVSSADTWLHQLDPSGHLSRKVQMTGIYFNQDHGERPWGLYCTRPVDLNADGADDLLVTTLASMEAQGLTPDGKKLWRFLAAYHGCMEMAVDDLDADAKPDIVIANKYGSVYVLRPDGTRMLSSNTSIGDVTFGLGDLNGDGKKEIVHGSSTGDLIAVNLQNKTLWRFDNYGYPVERIVCADLQGDGRPEVLVASGTGYVYCLDASGTPLWQCRLGLAVHDLAVTGGLVFAGTEDGEVHALDSGGKLRWTQSVGAPVTKLAVSPVSSGTALVAGCADGRLLALPLK